MQNKQHITVREDDGGVRLDKFITSARPDIPFSMANRLLRKGAVHVDEKRCRDGSVRLRAGQVVTLPDIERRDVAQPQRAANSDDVKRHFTQRIIYETDELIIINKDAGVATQGGSGVRIDIDSLQRGYCKERGIPPMRLVHRLDKDTSGALMLAKTRIAAGHLAGAFKAGEVDKTYLAITASPPPRREAEVDLPLSAHIKRGAQEKTVVDIREGRPAVTQYEVLARSKSGACLVRLTPRTGRMHQIRVHMAHIGAPILSDGKYGGRNAFISSADKNLHLHSHMLFVEGATEETAVAPPPSHFLQSAKALGLPLGGMTL